MKIRTVILAAGEGKRMKSSLAKPLHCVCGRPILEWVVEAARAVDPRPVVVVGHGREQVMARIHGVDFAVQEEQKGTGHAVMMAREFIQDADIVVVMAGDAPLIPGEMIAGMVEESCARGEDAALLTARMEDPTGYGRILTDGEGRVQGIVEHRDATEEQRQVKLINTLSGCYRGDLLLRYLDQLTCDNAQGEYYLTDVVGLMVRDGYKGGIALCPNAAEAMGVNDRVQLAQAEAAMRDRLNRRWMLEGVTLVDPARTLISADAVIGQDTVIYPDNVIEGKTVIGSGCILYPGSRITDSRIGNGVTVQASVLDHAQVGEGTTVGPFAYLRPGTQVGSGCRIGDFVEVKNSVIGDGTKVSHLTYVGDADLGQNINVGCGVVFVNYDGTYKYRSVVEDGAFIGCNTNLVAPVHVGQGAYTAAGSTITQDVPPQSLAIARARQVNKEGWKGKYKPHAKK